MASEQIKVLQDIIQQVLKMKKLLHILFLFILSKNVLVLQRSDLFLVRDLCSV